MMIARLLYQTKNKTKKVCEINKPLNVNIWVGGWLRRAYTHPPPHLKMFIRKSNFLFIYKQR